jgi:ribosomal protein S18 acetylase RimI-like enzyme
MMSDASGVTIRLAEPTDATALAQLRYDFRASQDPVTEPEADFLERCTSWMAMRLVPGSSWRCWIAEEAGQLVGTIWLQLIEKIPNPVAEAESHGYISSVYVDPARRGAGLGSRLLDTCMRVCMEEGVDAAILWPSPRSRRLYERHGFAVREDLFERRLGSTLSHAGAAP